MIHRTILALLLGCGTLAAARPAGAAAPTPAQRRCIVELNRVGANVAKATTRELLRCARLAVRGRLAAGQTIEQCTLADAHGRIVQARITTAVAEARWCDGTPPIGPRDADGVNHILDGLRQVRTVFGPDAAGVLGASADQPRRASCQVTVVRGMGRIAVAKLREFNRCTEEALAGGAESAQQLAACVGEDPRGRVARIAADVNADAARACDGEPVAAAFPGECASGPAGALGTCVEPRVHCDVCTGLNAADRTNAACHEFESGVATAYCGDRPARDHSVARLWDEELLAAIRVDTPRPVVHARNLFHLSVAMWDAWAAYDGTADLYLYGAREAAGDVAAAREVAISFAAFRLLRHRFAASRGAATSLARFGDLFYALGLDQAFTATDGDAPAAVGNRIAAGLIAHGLADGSNEANGYADPSYVPLNEPLVWKDAGTFMLAPSHWQPIALDVQIGQNGVPIPGRVQTFLGSHWGAVLPFALERPAPGVPYFDPPAPPTLEGEAAEFQDQAVDVIAKQSLLDSTDGTLVDGSPGTRGNNSLGANDGTGHAINPATGLAYPPNPVKRNDFYRTLGMYWADGPDSETPPGHWNVVANEVSDHPSFEKRLGGGGPVLDDLAWDVKLYLALNGAVHDAAIAAWEQKRVYDSVRPISMVRWMGGLGQSSDAVGPSYHPDGLPLVPGLIEVITADSSAPGERHAHLASFVGEIAVRGWRGEPANPRTTVGGIGWIRARRWTAYQKNTFVTPPFAGFLSGHSTFSRAAAEVLTLFTGDAFFPGGLGEFVAPADTYLPPEKGPTQPTTLQWATYYDAADQAGISRIWSGIHPRADDIPGRVIGSVVGIAAYQRALGYFDGSAVP
ncbi:MAG: vanadium-dependent haloperoxidase [Deltaproteobacteria bacterium]|nr:vanadium-dependent haloperoxidase [Deltaproteobacteria bacterium]